MYDNITGIILSGGKSTRMGENKSFLKMNNKTIIENVVEMMNSIFSKVILITNTPDEYEFLNLEIYTDIYKNVGPLAGIHSGLINSETQKNFIISCDIPLMNSEFIKSIINIDSEKQIIVSKADGFVQQLCGIYDKSLTQLISEIIDADNFSESSDSIQKKRKCKVHQLINKSNSLIIDDIEKMAGWHKEIFLNMNRKEDYEFILSYPSDGFKPTEDSIIPQL